MLEFDQLETGCMQGSRGDAGLAVDRAGWAASLEKDKLNILSPGNSHHLLGAFKKGCGEVDARPGEHPGFALKDVGAIATDNVGRFPRGRQATELFRTNRDPEESSQPGDTIGIFEDFTIIARAQANQTGADQAYGGWV